MVIAAGASLIPGGGSTKNNPKTNVNVNKTEYKTEQFRLSGPRADLKKTFSQEQNFTLFG